MSGVLLFDGDCGFCTSTARWLQRHARSTARVDAWQHAALAPLGLSPGECAEAVQWVDSGKRAAGPDALAAYLQTGTRSWRAVGRVLAAPVSRHVTWPVYRWIADHRGRLPGGTPASDLPRVPTPIKGIRRRKAKDLWSAARLLARVYSEDRYPIYWPEAPRRWLDGEDVIDAWVLERRGEIIGHVVISRVGVDALSALHWREVMGRPPTELAMVSRFFVRSNERGQGIGTALLDVAVSEIRARGLIPVVEVVSANQDAIELYEGQGWHLRATYAWGEKDDKLQLFFYSPPEPSEGTH